MRANVVHDSKRLVLLTSDVDRFEADVDFVDLLDEGYRLEKKLVEASLGSYEDDPRVLVQILY